jgi:hypothetical protein
MLRLRFEAITHCIHLVNNNTIPPVGQPGHNKLGKVRWLVVNCTVDEIMVPYKGRYCNVRQYMKGKPVRFSIKI